MKASELIKKSITIEEVYEIIETQNENGNHKAIFMFDKYISDSVKNQLMIDGFKCYYGHGFHYNDFIIEW